LCALFPVEEAASSRAVVRVTFSMIDSLEMLRAGKYAPYIAEAMRRAAVGLADSGEPSA
jgi:hypothetical protein